MSNVPIIRRKAYNQILDSFRCENNIVILTGLRKIGKTTVLHQLEEDFNGIYINLRYVRKEITPEELFVNTMEKALVNPENTFVLVDEICSMEGFDEVLKDYVDDIINSNISLVITSSAYTPLVDLHHGFMGARSEIVEMFPIDFEEYLLLSNTCTKVNIVNYTPTANDVENYIRLVNIPKGLYITANKSYLLSSRNDTIEAITNKSYSAAINISTDDNIIETVTDIFAYTLNQEIGSKIFRGKNIAGKQEFLNVTENSFVNSIVKLAMDNIVTINISNLVNAIYYLLLNGLLYVDVIVNYEKDDTTDILSKLSRFSESVEDNYNSIEERNKKSYLLNKLVDILHSNNLSIINPIIYGTLLNDLEIINTNEDGSKKYKDAVSIKGLMYELAVKAQDISNRGFSLVHKSSKFKGIVNDKLVEVDLVTTGYDSCNNKRTLILESTIQDKENNKFYIKDIYSDVKLIRVLACSEDKDYEFNEIYHRIPYPQALLMLSNKTIFDLEPTKIEESIGLELF